MDNIISPIAQGCIGVSFNKEKTWTKLTLGKNPSVVSHNQIPVWCMIGTHNIEDGKIENFFWIALHKGREPLYGWGEMLVLEVYQNAKTSLEWMNRSIASFWGFDFALIFFRHEEDFLDFKTCLKSNAVNFEFTNQFGPILTY